MLPALRRLGKQRFWQALNRRSTRVEVLHADGRRETYEGAEAFGGYNGHPGLTILSTARVLAVYRAEDVEEIRTT